MHEKIAKNTKNIPINSFLFAIFNSTKIFLKILIPNGGNFAETVTWEYPFQVKVSRKRYNWTQIHFVTHLLHQGHAWRRIDPEMADLEDFWVR